MSTDPKQRRLRALKKLQLEHHKLYQEYVKEDLQLQAKYDKLYDQFYAKRKTIVTGDHEPLDDELASDIEEDEDTGAKVEEVDDSKKGIPNFWLQVIENSELSNNIFDCDRPVLEHLVDLKFTRPHPGNRSIVVEFHFSPNPFFTNTVLTRSFEIEAAPQEKVELDQLYEQEQATIKKSEGTTINWNAGKSTLVHTVTKKQKHKTKGTRVITREEPNPESFFHFFTAPAAGADEGKEKDDEDFYIADVLVTELVEKAFLLYLGVSGGMDWYDEEGEDFEDDDEDHDHDHDHDDDDEDDDDDDDDHHHGKKGGKPMQLPGGKGKGKGKGKGEVPQCPQQ